MSNIYIKNLNFHNVEVKEETVRRPRSPRSPRRRRELAKTEKKPTADDGGKTEAKEDQAADDKDREATTPQKTDEEDSKPASPEEKGEIMIRSFWKFVKAME